MVDLRARKQVKFLGKFLVVCIGILTVGLFFRFMKIEPEEHTACSAPGLTCQATYDLERTRPIPIVDTAAILQGALAEAREQVRKKFFDDLEGRRLWGIDISKYQSNINWSLLVRRNKPDFVFVKATEGVTIRDVMYKSHKKNLEKHDILHGAYHFWSFRSSGAKQARAFIRHANLNEGNLVPMVDVEYPRGRMPRKAKVVRELKKFCAIIEAHYGVNPIIYTQPRLYRDYLSSSFSHYPKWFASYSRSPGYAWDIWQHTERGRVYGMPGRVDKNVMKSNMASLEKLVMF